MRALLLADTHVADLSDLHPKIQNGISEADLVIHLGDYTGKALVESLISTGKFKGVFGNMDSEGIKVNLPEVEIVEINRLRIVMVHGWGSSRGIERRIFEKLKDKRPSLILHGHSHIANQDTINGVLVVNPGSAGGRFPALQKSYCFLEITRDGIVNPEIVYIG